MFPMFLGWNENRNKIFFVLTRQKLFWAVLEEKASFARALFSNSHIRFACCIIPLLAFIFFFGSDQHICSDLPCKMLKNQFKACFVFSRLLGGVQIYLRTKSVGSRRKDTSTSRWTIDQAVWINIQILWTFSRRTSLFLLVYQLGSLGCALILKLQKQNVLIRCEKHSRKMKEPIRILAHAELIVCRMK